jgi:uncharacterized membrane protein YphA (DoxX/SURF4 family)
MSTLTRRLPTVARVFLGLAFLVFGLNGFLQFLPAPPPTGTAGTVIGAFVASGYLMALIKGTEIAVGLALLLNRFVPLALVVLAPIMVNIVLFHAFLAPAGTALPLVLLAAHLGLAWAYRGSFAGVLQARATPDVAPESSRGVTAAAAAS